MNQFSPEEISRIHSVDAEISRLLTEVSETDHPLEQQAAKDLLLTFITPSGSDHVVQVARDLLEEKIDRLVFEFVDAAARFYHHGDTAARAAESCDVVASLRRDQGSFLESPSIEQAQKLHAIFEEFAAANPLPEQTENFDAGNPPEADESASAAVADTGTQHKEDIPA